MTHSRILQVSCDLSWLHFQKQGLHPIFQLTLPTAANWDLVSTSQVAFAWDRSQTRCLHLFHQFPLKMIQLKTHSHLPVEPKYNFQHLLFWPPIPEYTMSTNPFIAAGFWKTSWFRTFFSRQSTVRLVIKTPVNYIQVVTVTQSFSVKSIDPERWLNRAETVGETPPFQTTDVGNGGDTVLMELSHLPVVFLVAQLLIFERDFPKNLKQFPPHFHNCLVFPGWQVLFLLTKIATPLENVWHLPFADYTWWSLHSQLNKPFHKAKPCDEWTWQIVKFGIAS